MRLFYMGFSALFFCILSPVAYTAANNKERSNAITWVKNPAPPFYIVAGEEAGQGFADGIQAQLEQAMPQFQHQTVTMPLNRLNDFWQKDENYCFTSMIYEPNSPSHDYVLSRPNVYYLPHGIITRHPSAIAAQGAIMPLQSLLQQPTYILGSIRNRTFGDTIDLLIEQHKSTTARFVRRDRDGLQSLIEMLRLERIDYFIDYAFVYDYYHRKPKYQSHLYFVTISETLNQGILGAIGCTNNAWGQGVIEQINHALDQLLTNNIYRQFLIDWQAVDATSQEYWQRFTAAAAAAQYSIIQGTP